MSSCRIMSREEKVAERHRWNKIFQRMYAHPKNSLQKRQDAALLKALPYPLAQELKKIEQLLEKFGKAGRASNMPRKDKISKRFMEILQSRPYELALKAADHNRPGTYRP